jgi:membrane protein insertase Oxa1/YidC/SpoIIIJ
MVLIGLVSFHQQMISSHEQTAREILYNNNVIQTNEARFLFLCCFFFFFLFIGWISLPLMGE